MSEKVRESGINFDKLPTNEDGVIVIADLPVISEADHGVMDRSEALDYFIQSWEVIVNGDNPTWEAVAKHNKLTPNSVKQKVTNLVKGNPEKDIPAFPLTKMPRQSSVRRDNSSHLETLKSIQAKLNKTTDSDDSEGETETDS